MKRILALILCLTCLLGVLTSCANTPKEPVDTNPPANNNAGDENNTASGSIPLAQYTIVYPKKASKALKETAKRLQESITAHLNGNKIPMISDDQLPKTGYEILIGKTSRPISQAYYAEGVKSEFTLRNVNQTLMMAGFSDVLTDKAVKYFEDTYLSNVTDGKILAVTDYTGTLEKTFELSETNAAAMKVVYSEDMETIAGKVVTAVKTATGITLTKQAAGTSYKYDAATPEILVGSFGVKETQMYENSLWVDGYVLANSGNKIIVSATDGDQYATAITALEDLLSMNRVTGGNGVYLFGDDVRRVVGADVLSNVVGVSKMPTNVYPAGDGAYVAIFEDVKESTRANSKEKFFTEYVTALEAAGFTKYTATSFDGKGTLNKNHFATYVNDEVSVDVAFHTVGHLGMEKLEEGDDAPIWWEAFNDGIMMVTVTPKSAGLTLPLQSAPAYTALDSTQYPTLLTSVGCGRFHLNEASNCYIIRLADGTFIVHDSSYGGGVTNRTTADAIYEILKKQAPDPNNIVISAWITTHPHQDHMNGLTKFATKYATGAGVTVKQFVHNFADDSIATDSEISNQDEVRLAVKKFPGAEVVKPYAGNVLYYANVKFNILYSHIDHLPLNKGERYDGNCSTLVMQMVTDDGLKVLFGGDHSAAKTNYGTGNDRYPFTWGALREWYGSFIESDIMTYFHHGLGGGTDWDTNATIKPKIVLWPCTWNKINGANLLNSGHSVYLTRITDNAEGGSFTEGILHETPNYKGVYGWFVADDNIHIVNLDAKNAQGLPTVTTYDSFDDYLPNFYPAAN